MSECVTNKCNDDVILHSFYVDKIFGIVGKER